MTSQNETTEHKTSDAAAIPDERLVMCHCCEKFFDSPTRARLCDECSEWCIPYEVGEIVECNMPHAKPKSGWLRGEIMGVVPNFHWRDEERYEVHGDGYVTTTSARNLRKIRT